MKHGEPHGDTLLADAKELREQGDNAASRARLREYLLRQHALLWLARVSSDPREALAAAELARYLAPEDEIVQRALLATRERAVALSQPVPERAELSARIALITGMTITQARAVKWPFRGINQPIGSAFDNNDITLKDLLWAVDEVSNAGIRSAARTILLSHLLDAQAERPATLTIIRGSRYSEYEERIAVFWTGVYATLILLITVIVILGSLIGFLSGPSIERSILLVVLTLASVFLYRFALPRIERAVTFRIGRLGEERVVESLRSVLDGNWTLIRNFTWPRRRDGDIDLVLIGPGGVWVFEVKAYHGDVRNVGDTWERRTKRRWSRLPIHPGQQARRNAAHLKSFLEEQGISLPWIEPVIIWAGGEEDNSDRTNTLALDQPKTRVWRSAEIGDHVVELWQQRRELEPEMIHRIVDVLHTTIERSQRDSKR